MYLYVSEANTEAVLSTYSIVYCAGRGKRYATFLACVMFLQLMLINEFFLLNIEAKLFLGGVPIILHCVFGLATKTLNVRFWVGNQNAEYEKKLPTTLATDDRDKELKTIWEFMVLREYIVWGTVTRML